MPTLGQLIISYKCENYLEACIKIYNGVHHSTIRSTLVLYLKYVNTVTYDIFPYTDHSKF